jgi:hypothetical protein
MFDDDFDADFDFDKPAAPAKGKRAQEAAKKLENVKAVKER